jgi:hypothetical protein
MLFATLVLLVLALDGCFTAQVMVVRWMLYLVEVDALPPFFYLTVALSS